MADIHGESSKMAELLSLTAEVYSASSRYINSIKNASPILVALQKELRCLKLILTEIPRRIEQEEWGDWVKVPDSPTSPIEDVGEYREALEMLKSRLQRSDVTAWSDEKVLAWPIDQKETEKVIDILHKCVRTFGQSVSVDLLWINTEILEEVDFLKQEKIQTVRNGSLQWLSPERMDMWAAQRHILAKRVGHTGEWLLSHKLFKIWSEQSSSPILWCPGQPGAGKTVLCSIVAEYLRRKCVPDQIACAIFFCDYKDQVSQTALCLLRNIAKQLFSDLPSSYKLLEEFQDRAFSHSSQPTVGDIEALLQSLCDGEKEIYIVIDALDELLPEHRALVLPVLRGLQQSGARVLTTGRPYTRDIEHAFDDQGRLDIEAPDEDIRFLVKNTLDKMEELSQVLQNDEELVEEIISSTTAVARGMILFPVLQVVGLRGSKSKAQIRERLTTIPNNVFAMYQQTVDRIMRQNSNMSELAIKVLSWISLAERPLQVAELQHALAVRFGDGEDRNLKYDSEDLIDSTILLDVCEGIVTIDPTTKIIHFVHYTAHEFFRKNSPALFPDMLTRIAGTCISYLLLDEFAPGPCLDHESLVQRKKKYQFLEYAAVHWGDHVRGQLESRFLDSILKLLKDDKRLCASVQASTSREPEFFRWCNRFGEEPSGFGSLHCAAAQGLDQTISILLKEGCEATEIDGTFKTPTHWAAWRGNCSALSMLLETGVDRSIKSEDGFTLLDAAVDQNREDAVRLLLDCGCDVNQRGFGNGTALLTAALMGHEKMVSLLLENGADCQIDNQFNEAALFKATFRGSEKMVEMLLKHGAHVDHANICGNTALHGAAITGRCNIVEMLLNAGADVNRRTQDGATPLLLAAYQGHEELVRLLIARGAEIESKTFSEKRSLEPLIREVGRCIPVMVSLSICGRGASALNEAAYHGHEAVVRCLLEMGADPNSTDADEYSPLCQAIESACHTKLNGHRLSIDTAKAAATNTSLLLLRHGVDVNTVSKAANYSALHCAADVGNVEIAQLLLEHNANLNAKEASGRTPIHVAAHAGHAHVVKLFIKQEGAKTLDKDDSGCTVLHLAAASGDMPTLKVLLDSDLVFDLEEEDGKGVPPLLRSIWSMNTEAVQFLLDRGASVSHRVSGGPPNLDAASIAVMHEAKDILNLLIDRGAKLDLVLPNEETLLHIAARNNKFSVLPVLVDHGLSLSATTKAGETPLHVAALKGNIAVAEWLIDHGAVVDAIDKYNGTPLGLAANAGGEETVDMLCQKGADVNKVWDDGMSILEDAIRRKFVDVAQKLVSHGAKQLSEARLQEAFEEALKDENCLMLRFLIDLDGSSFLQKGTLPILPTSTPFHAAARHCDLELAKFLIEKGFKADANSLSDKSAIQIAVEEKHRPMIEFLLANGGHSDPAKDDLVQLALGDWDQETAIFLIQKGVTFDHQEILMDITRGRGQERLAKVILEEVSRNGVRIDWDDIMSCALRTNNDEMCDLLFDNGARLDARGLFGRTALHLVEGVDRARSLLARGACLEARDHQSATPLLLSQSAEMTEFLVSQGADLHAKDRKFWTALHYASSHCSKGGRRPPSISDVGGGEIVKYLVSRGIDPNVIEQHGYTPLHIACAALDLSAVQVLLASGAKADTRAIDGDEPIHALFTQDGRYWPPGIRAARISGSPNSELPQILDRLIECGAKINAVGKSGQTPLHRATKLGRADLAAEWLLDRGADMQAQDRYGNTPLLHAYSQHDSVDFVEVLLKRGADLQQHLERHQHELDCALDRHDLTLVGVLLDHGVTTQRKSGFVQATSLHEAARMSPQLLKYLLNQASFDNEEKDSRGYTPLGAAIDIQNTKSVQILLDQGATCEVVGPCPCGKKEHTATALRVAAANGDVEVLRLLLKAGALPNARNSNNNTALTYAAENGQAECLKLLLEIPEIEVNAVDDDGDSALLCAVHGGHSNTTKIFLARKDVDRSIRNKLGVTAEELAQRDKKWRIMRLFEEGVQDTEEDDSDSDSSFNPYVVGRRRRHSPRARPRPRVYPRRRVARHIRPPSMSDD